VFDLHISLSPWLNYHIGPIDYETGDWEIRRVLYLVPLLAPITKKQPPLKWCETGDREFEGSYLWFDKTSLVEVEVVDERPPPNFNPPLTDPEAPILVQVKEIFSEPFSLFSSPHTMSVPSVSSSVFEPSSPSSSGTWGIPVMSTLLSLTTIGPTLYIPFSIGPSI
jgi:hypothetical protein